jgi:hypothetical protein
MASSRRRAPAGYEEGAPFSCLVVGDRNGKEGGEAPSVDKEDIRMLKTLAREGIKTTSIARKLKRTYAATRQRASKLGVSLGVR